MFASHYLEKNKNSLLVELSPNIDTGIIIVIPCLNEPEVIHTLKSIHSCSVASCHTEIILVINHSRTASARIRNINNCSKCNIQNWIIKNRNDKLSFFVVGPLELPVKWAGAGLARKKGMDEAVSRFNLLDKPDGIIVSLDADTIVEKNYLQAIESHFILNSQEIGATIPVKHQVQGLTGKHLEGIILYEKYMNYYRNAVGYTGFPYPMFTVGSAFAVKAAAYVRRGGMNRRKAGEDFYFLQNLVQMGPVGELKNTTVHPSARLSDRVPFGTGPILQKWLNNEKDLTKTYNIRAFEDLKIFFGLKDRLFKISREGYHLFLERLPGPVAVFLKKDDFWSKLADLNSNCSCQSTFHLRFFQKFNAFKVLKFLNFAHEDFYKKEDINELIKSLEEKLH